MKIALVLLIVAAFASAQRITTIQLDGVQYFVSRMNPYSPELNYFLAYQYCRSLGLQLASFETKEKADTMTQYLKNAGYTKYDFWTSGNKLGTDMFLWMSSGLPFNATFDYMFKRPGNRPVDVPPGTEPQRVARESGDSGSADGCVAMMAPTLSWEAQDCTFVKDFICEQTRCYYYNYGSIPVSATQGNRRPYITTTLPPASDDQVDDHQQTQDDTDDRHDENANNQSTSGLDDGTTALDEREEQHHEEDKQQEEVGQHPQQEEEQVQQEEEVEVEQQEQQRSEKTEESSEDKLPEDPVVSRLMTTASPASGNQHHQQQQQQPTESSIVNGEQERQAGSELEDTRPDHIPDIASLFTDNPGAPQSRKDNVFEGLETHEILRTSSRSSSLDSRLEHRESPDYSEVPAETELPNNGLEDAHTIGPYDTVQDYANDQPDIVADSPMTKDQDDDSSTILPEAEPAYRYNIKVRTNGKVLNPPSQ